MRFHADLHIHSKHSRATSRDLNLESLSYWARRKGITVVGTGDFTHPVWIAELKEKLVPAEPGFFKLRQDLDKPILEKLPPACRTPVRFMLSVEISTIYKSGDLTRKIHHLLYAPDLATAERISASLARIGNITADGRPILGLDSRNLLEITLAANPEAYLVPAHIWTPWFAVLGSQSGFDSIAECYRDLADHIFAVETGLSSDPSMNWRLSFLDKYRLVSNSDAHSPAKLGRETTLFDCDLDYYSLKNALKTGEGYVGTVEFFPEEGKYHMDGHRKCNVRLTPEQTKANGKRCPVCGQPVTVGVLHRVEALADRTEAEALPPPTAGEASNLVPLPEVLSELASTGPASKTVERTYNRLIDKLGPELEILQSIPVEDIARADSSLLAEAITRLRAGKVFRDAGYDGEYGVIKLFEENELRRLTQTAVLFDLPMPEQPTPERSLSIDAPQPPTASPSRIYAPKLPASAPGVSDSPTTSYGGRGASVHGAGILDGLDDAQCIAAQTVDGPLLIVAGPGSGKTRTLTHRIAHLIAERGVSPNQCLAITFTRRAANEMRERLAGLLPGQSDKIAIHTFHSLGLDILREHANAAGLQRGFAVSPEEERVAALAEALNVSHRKATSLLRGISKTKRTQRPPTEAIAEAQPAYDQVLTLRNWIDFDDLIGLPVRILESDPGLALLYRDRFRWISADEFQDVDEQQYRLLTLLASPEANLCVIGDPDQAIYGFRGADASCFERFRQDYPTAKTVSLNRNYRSSGTIVTASSQVIQAHPRSENGGASMAHDRPSDRAVASPTSGGLAAAVGRDMLDRITLHTAPTERAEAEFVIQSIEALIGGHSFFSIDSGRAGAAANTNATLGFADFAVLYRTNAQGAALREAFERSGIPFKQHGHDPHLERRPAQEPTEEVNSDAAATPASTSASGNALPSRDSPFPGETSTSQDAPVPSIDTWDPQADRVSLLTLHAAKGLEFPVVFIVGLEDGILPLHWSRPDEATLAEERRLFYVGMTRAKDRLFLSRALKRQLRGKLQPREASPFLKDIEQALLKHQQSRPAPPKKPQDDQLGLF